MKYEYWFAGIRNIPDRTKIKLKEKAGTAEAIYYIEETALRKMQLLKEQEIWKLLEAKKKEELDRNYEAMRQKGISVIPWGEKEYPGRLKEIYDPPYALYVKGKLPDNTARAAAIVGARSCTPFYPDLDEAVKTAEKELESVKIEDEVTDVICEECGRNMVIKYGPHGKFLACPGFPDCRNTKPYLEKIGVACPICGKEVVIRKTKKGRKYYGCENNPECDFMSWQKPSKEKCPECGGYMVEKGNKLVCANEQCGYVRNLKGN